MSEVLRYAAFTHDPAGGNPAGVVLDAGAMAAEEMLAVAAEVGYSESAFVIEREEAGEADVRYFSPLAEVPFCGHATIALAVALAERDGPGEVLLHTANGPVPVRTRIEDGTIVATLTSVPPAVSELDEETLDRLLALLSFDRDDLDPKMPVRVGYAGAFHPIIPLATRERLADLDYDFDGLGDLMRERDWTTIQIVWRESNDVFHARDPFPVGGVVEDPATGAAAAALGGYLRELGLVAPPARVTIHQGHDLGRPGTLLVDIPADREEIEVTGAAVPIGS